DRRRGSDRGIAEGAAQLPLRIMRGDERARLGEMDAVTRPELGYLAGKVRAGRAIGAVRVDETVPYIEIDAAGRLDAIAIDLVEPDDIGGQLVILHRRQA